MNGSRNPIFFCRFDEWQTRISSCLDMFGYVPICLNVLGLSTLIKDCSEFYLRICSFDDVIHLFITGDGEVYIWDMKSKRCVHKFRDEGCLKGTCIDVSKDGRYVACG